MSERERAPFERHEHPSKLLELLLHNVDQYDGGLVTPSGLATARRIAEQGALLDGVENGERVVDLAQHRFGVEYLAAAEDVRARRIT